MLTSTQHHKFESLMKLYWDGQLHAAAQRVKKLNKVDLVALILHTHCHELINGHETRSQERNFHQFVEGAVEGFYD